MAADYDEFKIDIKMRLGWPVINIELAEEQIDLAIREAITFYQRNHFDGSEQIYMPIQITSDIKTNRYIELDKSVIGVNKMFDLSASSSSNILSTDFIISADAAWTAFRSGAGLSGYYNMMSYRSLIQQTFTGKVPTRFNYNRGRVYIDMSSEKFEVGSWILLDVQVAIDPSTNTRMYEDPFLNDYAEAKVKRAWGQLLKKYSGVSMPGGIQLDGKTIYDEAVQSLTDLEEECRTNYSLPLDFFVG